MYRFALLLCLVFSSLTLAADDELLLFTVDAATLSRLLQKPILKNEPIDETVKRTTLKGLAQLSGQVTAIPVPSQNGIQLQMSFASQTNVATTNTGDGKKAPGEGKSHPEIAFQFSSTIGTHAQTYKTLTITEEGFAQQPAFTTEYQSQIQQFGNLRTQAQGLLLGRRIEVREVQTPSGTIYERERLGLFDRRRLPIEGRGAAPGIRAQMAIPQVKQEFFSQKTTDDAGRSVTEKLTKQFNESVWEELAPYRQKFAEYFYNPFIRDGFLGGHFAMGSDFNRIAIQGLRGSKAPPLDVSGITGVDPLWMRVSEDFVTEFAERRLAGTMLSDVELAEMFGRAIPENFSLRSDPQTVVFVLQEKRPIVAAFDADKISFTFRLREARTLGKTLTNLKVVRSMALLSGTRGEIYLQHTGAKVTDDEDRPLEGAVAAHVAKRFSAWVPPEMKEITKTVLLEDTIALQIRTLRTHAGKLMLGMAPKEKGLK